MIAMAHARGMKITAEGVETLSQCQALKALRCDNLQGYLLSKPLSRDMALSKIGSDTSETLGPIAKA
jgi:EAL domain-containing protein (putative c-di-GMP-specific phosphodiesterase class I)